MLLRNIPRGCEGSGLVNGSIGRIIAYERGDIALQQLRAQLRVTDESSFLHVRLLEQIEAIHDDVQLQPEIAYPRVSFLHNVLGSCSTIEITVRPACFSKSIYLRGTCKRQQLPLRLAWAITIHKSQGASLSCAIVSLEGCDRNAGQAYVALSRCRVKERLQVVGFNARMVVANPLAVRFMDVFSAAADMAPEEGREALAAYFATCEFWMAPLLNSSVPTHAQWLPLFLSSDVTHGWLTRYCGYNAAMPAPPPAVPQGLWAHGHMASDGLDVRGESEEGQQELQGSG